MPLNSATEQWNTSCTAPGISMCWSIAALHNFLWYEVFSTACDLCPSVTLSLHPLPLPFPSPLQLRVGLVAEENESSEEVKEPAAKEDSQPPAEEKDQRKPSDVDMMGLLGLPEDKVKGLGY